MSTSTQTAPPMSAPPGLANGHTESPNHTTPPMQSVASSKKGKAKKEKLGPDETSKLLAAKISQLEQDAAGEKDQDAEIEREVKKANRDLHQLLNTMEPMARLDMVVKKYGELLADMKKLDRDHAKNKKRADQLQKEQEKAKTEHSKTVGIKDKLEKLCRELTKENKKVKDENKKLLDTEREARGLVNEKLDTLLYDVQDVMNSKTSPHSEDLNMSVDEVFKAKFKTYYDHNNLRELQFKAIIRQKDCEIQHLNAKCEFERKKYDAEAARSRTLSSQVSTFSHTESELRSQLNIYVEKFKQVEDTLNNSNELFLTFRKEMEEMSKKTKRLEKENLTLARKHEQGNRKILEMAERETQKNTEVETLRKRDKILNDTIKQMQGQNRGVAAGGAPELDDEGTESEYDEEYDEDEDEDEEGSYDGEHDLPGEIHKPVFGPVPPPALSETRTNGNKGGLNGIKA